MKKNDVTVVSVCEFRPKRADCFFVEFFAEVLRRWFMWFPNTRVFICGQKGT